MRARYDGTYDTTNLPDELVMSSPFSVSEGKIESLTVIFNQPSALLRGDPGGPGIATPNPVPPSSTLGRLRQG